jgi:YD repeat-containing protein
LSSLHSPDAGVTVITRDEAGNVVEVEDARGVVSAMTYDALDRVDERTYLTSAEDVTYGYDDTTGGNHGVGRLTGIADETGTTSLVYDLRGNGLEAT